MTEEQKVIIVSFKFMQSGWRHESRKLSKQELDALLDEATVIRSDLDGWSESKKLCGITLRLKDGRKCKLTEENEMYYDGCTGWINIFISEDWSE
jgi:hypothetical protein